VYAAFGNIVAPLISPDHPLDDAWPWPGNPVTLAVIAASLLLYAYTRRTECDCQTSLDLGSLYEVGLALAIGLVNQWTPNTVGVSWIAVLIVLHPAIVPNTGGRTLAASFAAASMDLVGVGVAGLRGVELPPMAVVLWASLPNYIAAGLALVPATVIRHLGRQVGNARELGSYQLGELLGRGGMGEVYRGRHRMLRRPAAIKLIRPDPLSGRPKPQAVHRFRREAEAVAALHSPHSVALYDFGLTADGTFYYVMELLNGLDFEALVRRFGPVPPARMVYLLTQACRSLAEAHALGLVHRDIKPANLFTCRLGREHDFVKVLDFGRVKAVGSASRDQPAATAPGITTGTPSFSAPEAALGGDDVDHRADIYALGCVAYWLLTGRYVFDADNAVQMLYQHIHAEPVPPSRRTELPIPPSVDALVLACLAKNRADRPVDADTVADRLAACELGDDAWTPERSARWWRTHAPEMALPAPPESWTQTIRPSP
jgi:serine/threonine-protein kinase